MQFSGLFKFSVQNLLRSKVRTLLTVLGVAIGSGALVAMVSYGTGTQKNFNDEFTDLELFNTIRVTSTRVDLTSIFSFSKRTMRNLNDKSVPNNPIVLTDAVMDSIRKTVKGVSPDAVVYAEVNFPCKIMLDTLETAVMSEALPASIATFGGYNQITCGRFFMSDTAKEVVVSEILLNRMGLQDPKVALGKTIVVSTIALDVEKVMAVAQNPMSLATGSLPVSETPYRFTIVGVLSKDIQKMSSGFRLIIPFQTARTMNKINFVSTLDLLRKSNRNDGYQAIIVRAANVKDVERLKTALEKTGLNVLSFTDQFNEFKKLFLLFDLALAIVGTIALIVATLGITNTMIMSIMERYREIGIMKAVGAMDADIRKIFFVESSLIGFAGGVLGVVLGWLVTKGINAAVGVYVTQQSGAKINFFYFPWWLVTSAVVFSVFVSLIAGYYPARRASRIEPVAALRHE
jgi:putative ABC transport system permease protein